MKSKLNLIFGLAIAMGLCVSETYAQVEASNQSVNVSEGTAHFSLSLNTGRSIPTSESTVTILSLPAEGTLELREYDSQQGQYVYPLVQINTPFPASLRSTLCYSTAPGKTGVYPFTWKWKSVVGGTSVESNVGTFSLNVQPNTPPEARNQSMSKTWAPELPVTLLIIDPDSGQPRNITILSTPSVGTLQMENAIGGYETVTINSTTDINKFRYIPPTGFAGNTSFQWKVNDGIADSNVGTYSLEIKSPNAPLVYDTRIDVIKNEAVIFRPRFWDADSENTFTFTVTSLPTKGVLEYQSSHSAWTPFQANTPANTLYNGHFRWRYTPNTNYTGTDSFAWKMNDAIMGETGIAICEILVREATDRAGMLVDIVVNSALLPEIQLEVDRLKSDIESEGYTASISPLTGSTSATNLWAHLHSKYANGPMAGAILIGNLAAAKTRHYGTNAESGETTDLAYWCMSRFGWRNYLYAGNGFVQDEHPHDIWVSRIRALSSSGAALPYGSEVTLIRRALNANHAARTGASRLPHAAFWNNTFGESDKDLRLARLAEIWPNAQRANNETAWTAGGDVLEEQQHGNANLYEGGGGKNITRDGIHSLLAQVRYALNSSCSSGAFGGVVNSQIFTRGGGNVLSVGASATTYEGAFEISNDRGPDIQLRARLAAGDTWGSALSTWYGFGDDSRAVFYGDLSMPVKMFPPNAMPVINSLSASRSSGSVPLTVQFTATASDSDGTITTTEWFCEGHDMGRNQPTHTAQGAPGTVSHTFTEPGTYKVRVEVVDDYMARSWKETTVTANPAYEPRLLLYEGFDYALADGASLIGSGGNEKGFKSAETWEAQSGNLNFHSDSLNFGSGSVNLQTSGGAARFSSTANAYRGIETNHTGTLWGSYLWKTETAISTSTASGIGFASTGTSGLGTSEFGAAMHSEASPNGTAAYIKSVKQISSAKAAVGQVYLVLFKVENVNGTSGGSRITTWALMPEQFAAFKAAGLTENALNNATMGAGANQVFGRASASVASSRPALKATHYVFLRHYGGDITRLYDELRLAASEDDAAGLALVTPTSGEQDSDGDGIPDAWEIAHGLDPNNADDAALDSDGDGFTNLQEYIAGTDPTDANSFFRADEVKAGDATVGIKFRSKEGRVYGVQRRDSLEGGQWITLATGIPGTGEVIEVTDPNPAPDARFYRLTVSLP